MEEIFSHEYYMKQAIALAELALEKGEIPIGALVVAQNKIIAKAHNLTEALNDVTAHAEMQAITAASESIGGKYLNECTLYVTVEPCIMCASALAWSQLGALVYGTGDNKRGYTNYSPSVLHPRTEVTSGIYQDKCQELMQNFFSARR